MTMRTLRALIVGLRVFLFVASNFGAAFAVKTSHYGFAVLFGASALVSLYMLMFLSPTRIGDVTDPDDPTKGR